MCMKYKPKVGWPRIAGLTKWSGSWMGSGLCLGWSWPADEAYIRCQGQYSACRWQAKTFTSRSTPGLGESNLIPLCVLPTDPDSGLKWIGLQIL